MMVAFLVTMVCLLPFHEKVLDVEPKSKYYKDCMQIKKKRIPKEMHNGETRV